MEENRDAKIQIQIHTHNYKETFANTQLQIDLSNYSFDTATPNFFTATNHSMPCMEVGKKRRIGGHQICQIQILTIQIQN